MIYMFSQNHQYENAGRNGERHFLELISCTRRQYNDGCRWRLVPSDRYTLICVLSGAVEVLSLGRTAAPGEAVLLELLNDLDERLNVSASELSLYTVVFASGSRQIPTAPFWRRTWQLL